MRYSTCLIQLVCLALVFLPLSHCSRAVIFPMDANLIDQTCKKTPNYNLCVSSLKSDPRSAKANVAGLGFITVDIAKAKATDAANKISQLLKQRPSDQRLKSCATFYHTILVADVPEASQGFKLGDPKFAEQGMNDAAGAAEACEKEFSGKSPLTVKNKVVHDFSSIAAAIARLHSTIPTPPISPSRNSQATTNPSPSQPHTRHPSCIPQPISHQIKQWI